MSLCGRRGVVRGCVARTPPFGYQVRLSLCGGVSMLSGSVVSQRDIRLLLAERYDIQVTGTVASLKGGSANCYKIRAPEGNFLLKEFQPKYSVEDVRTEPEVTAFVARRGIPVAGFVATVTGEYVWEHRGRAFHLQNFLEGKIFPQNGAPDWLLRESAILLGRLHAVLADFARMKIGFPDAWFAWDATVKHREYDELIRLADELPDGEKRDRILRDLHYKRELLTPDRHPQIDPAQLTFGNSHGDYHILQLVCGQESVEAVIDFSSACSLPLTWEVMRSYSLGDPACAAGKLGIDRLRDYVRRYLKAGGELSEYDLRMMPYLYHLQLARSRYGYQEYLSQGLQGIIHNRLQERLEELLKFGFWRTDMCRWLEVNAESVSLALLELLK
jgi:Ser/Thr protein kinase RdoA (MazF antagonist)